VSIEPLAEVSARESSRVGDRLGYAKRVGMDLYHFLASFATQTSGDTIVIPTKALDRCEWKRLIFCSEVLHGVRSGGGAGSAGRCLGTVGRLLNTSAQLCQCRNARKAVTARVYMWPRKHRVAATG
jgi:hypothetical protein